MKRIFSLVLALIQLLALSSPVYADAYHISGKAYYVSAENGNDENDGTEAAPFKTIQRAADVLSAGDICYIMEGTYFEEITPKNSGTKTKPITFQNYKDDKVIVSGSDVLSGFTPVEDNIYSTDITTELYDYVEKHMLFIDDEFQNISMWPNFEEGNTLLEPNWAVIEESDKLTWIVDKELPQLSPNWEGAVLRIRPGYDWYNRYARIAKVDNSQKRIDLGDYEGGDVISGHINVGNRYIILNSYPAMDKHGEWYFDQVSRKLYMYLDKAPEEYRISWKTRKYSFDLSNRNNIKITGITTHAASINMFETKRIDLDRMEIAFLSEPLVMNGEDGIIHNCHIYHAYMGAVKIDGERNILFNNLIEFGCYANAKAQSLVDTYGANNCYIGYNTIRNAGRDVITPTGIETIIEYNRIYGSALCTSDNGSAYAGFIDGVGTEFRYNWCYDNHSHGLGVGFYLDNGNSNIVAHHNVIWNDVSPNAPSVCLNPSSSSTLVYNNTFIGGRVVEGKNAILGRKENQRLVNNLFINSANTFKYNISYNNMWGGFEPLFVDAKNHDFRLSAESEAIDAGVIIDGITDGFTGAAPDLGAYEHGKEFWIPGHNFDNPPELKTESVRDYHYSNRIRFSDFEFVDSLEETYWERTGAKQAEMIFGWSDSVEHTSRWQGRYGLRLGRDPQIKLQEEDVNRIKEILGNAEKREDLVNYPEEKKKEIIEFGRKKITDIFMKSGNVMGISSFEGEEKWTDQVESSTVTVTDEIAATGTHSLKVEPKFSWSGPRKRNIAYGKRYLFSAKVYSKSSGTVTASHHNSNGFQETVDRQELKANQWITLRGIIDATKYSEELVLCLDNSAVQIFYVDDIELLDLTVPDTIYTLIADRLPSTADAAEAVINGSETTMEDISSTITNMIDVAVETDKGFGLGLIVDVLDKLYRLSVSLEDGVKQHLYNLEPLTTYEIACHARKTDETDSVTYEIQNYGGEPVMVEAATINWNDEVVKLYFTTGPNNTTADLYINKPEGKKCAYIDAMWCAPVDDTPRMYKDNKSIVVNGDLETGNPLPWYNFHADLSVVQEAGNNILSVSGAATGKSVLATELNNIDKDKRYSVSGLVRLGDGIDERARMRCEIVILEDGMRTIIPIDEADITKDKWYSINKEIDVNTVKVKSATLKIYLEGSENGFCIDGFIGSEVMKPTMPGTGDTAPSMKENISDSKQWKFSDTEQAANFRGNSVSLKSGYGRYTGKTYRDCMLEFYMSINGYRDGHYPMINIRNQGIDSYSSGYAMIIRDTTVEIQKYIANGTELMFAGNEAKGEKMTGVYGYAIPITNFVMGEDNLIEVGSCNEENGVRIMLSINGVEILNFLDSVNPVVHAGHFGIYTGGVEEVVISAEK